MRTDRRGEVIRQVQTLCHLGTVGEMSDGDLLDRFVQRRGVASEVAFDALVERHGPMVLRACRSVLRDEHEAQDALQATFLILFLRAASIRKRGSVASWLHGVALKVAAGSRLAAGRRRLHERRAAEQKPVTTLPASPDPDLNRVLHEELGRLPERYRSAVVLCYLEGRTLEEAARHLGWPVGSIKSRLSRGHEKLRRRLIRRGVGPSVALFAVESLASASRGARVSESLAIGKCGAMGVIPSGVGALARGALSTMFMVRLKAVALPLLLATPLVAAIPWLHPQAPAGGLAGQQGGGVPKADLDDRGGDPTTKAMLSGLVRDPDGGPSSGAEVLLMDGYIPLTSDGRVAATGGEIRRLGREGMLRGRGRSDAEGRFRFEVGGSPIDASDRVVLWAYRPGATAFSVEVPRKALASGESIEIRLERRSRAEFTVLGPDGRPVAGARVVPTVLSRAHLPVPEPLRELAAAVTDEEGKAVVEAFRPEEITCVRTTSVRFGMQQWADREFGVGGDAKVITLLAAGSLRGRLIAAKGELAGRRKLLIATIPEAIPGPFVGVVDVTSDGEGRFEVPVLAAGRLVIRAYRTEGGGDYLNFPQNSAQIEGGRLTEVVLRLDQATPAKKP